MVWSTVATFVVKLNCRSITYCGRAKAGTSVAVGNGVSVGSAVSVGTEIVAVGSAVSVGEIEAEVGAAHETIRKIQMKANPTLVVVDEYMELILLDLRLSLNNEAQPSNGNSDVLIFNHGLHEFALIFLNLYP